MSELSVPWLRSGTGATPAEGGCILQVIDWIDRHSWTDRPVCVHRVLAKLAILANDTLPDGERQKLLDLAPRLMRTASDDKKLSVQLAVFLARQVLPIFEKKYPNNDRPRKSIEAAEAWIENPTEENRQKAIEARRSAYAAAYAAAAYAADAAYAAYAGDAAYAADAAAAYAAYAAAAAAAYAAAAAKRGQAVYDLLVVTLDEYDRLTGRTVVESVDLSPAAVAMCGVKS